MGHSFEGRLVSSHALPRCFFGWRTGGFAVAVRCSQLRTAMLVTNMDP